MTSVSVGNPLLRKGGSQTLRQPWLYLFADFAGRPLLVTGPVTENMRAALLDTYETVPDPKLVIAVGACAIAGGPFRDQSETHNGIGDLLPVDLFVPGCPPHPYTILDGLLRLLGRIKRESSG